MLYLCAAAHHEAPSSHGTPLEFRPNGPSQTALAITSECSETSHVKGICN